MDFAETRARVRTILEHADDRAWTMQEIGLLGLRLDGEWANRLHVWGPSDSLGDPPVHDHPFDFTSTVVVGELTNTRYREDPWGVEYQRFRYPPGDEQARTVDTVCLTATPTVLREGDEYSQPAHQLHDSRQVPGTVTLLRWSFREVPALTVCTAPGAPWVSGRSRPATPDEVQGITGAALDRFG